MHILHCRTHSSNGRIVITLHIHIGRVISDGNKTSTFSAMMSSRHTNPPRTHLRTTRCPMKYANANTRYRNESFLGALRFPPFDLQIKNIPGEKPPRRVARREIHIAEGGAALCASRVQLSERAAKSVNIFADKSLSPSAVRESVHIRITVAQVCCEFSYICMLVCSLPGHLLSCQSMRAITLHMYATHRHISSSLWRSNETTMSARLSAKSIPTQEAPSS